MTREVETAPPRAHTPGPDSGARGSSLVGRYRLVSQQGTGLFGTVWLAEEAVTGQPVALRLLPRALTDMANVAETIRRRARAVVEASRAHPGLVGVIEYGITDDGQLFAVMERASGRSLSEAVESHRPHGLAALRLAVEMGAPLEILHNMGLVHGAIRPGNFVVAAGRVSLMDIETIALRDAPALQHLVAAQTPAAYLTPEQILGRPVSEKTDVYAFGVTFYELLSGAPPFGAQARGTVRDMHLNAPVPLPRRRRMVPVSVEAVLLEALGKRPEQRPHMPRILNHISSEVSSALRWRRAAIMVAGVVVAAAVAPPIASSLLAARVPAPLVSAPVSPPPEAPPPIVLSPAITFLPGAGVSEPPRLERGEPPRPADATRASPNAEPDPSAVIDWLLNRRGP